MSTWENFAVNFVFKYSTCLTERFSTSLKILINIFNDINSSRGFFFFELCEHNMREVLFVVIFLMMFDFSRSSKHRTTWLEAKHAISRVLFVECFIPMPARAQRSLCSFLSYKTRHNKSESSAEMKF